MAASAAHGLSTIVVQWDVTTWSECRAHGAFPFHVFDAPAVFKGAFSGLHITDEDIARIACASKAHCEAVKEFKQRSDCRLGQWQ